MLVLSTKTQKAIYDFQPQPWRTKTQGTPASRSTRVELSMRRGSTCLGLRLHHSWHHKTNEIATRTWDVAIWEDSILFWECMVFFVLHWSSWLSRGISLSPGPHCNFLLWFLFNKLQTWLSPWAQIWHWWSPGVWTPPTVSMMPCVTSLHDFSNDVYLSTMWENQFL